MKITAGPWSGLELTVCDANDRPLPEYHHPATNPATHRFIVYIEAVPGTQFAVILHRPVSPTALAITLHADGDKVLAGVVPGYKRRSVIDGYNKGSGADGCWKALAFGEGTPHAQTLAPPLLYGSTKSGVGKLGTLHVRLEKGWCHSTRQMGWGRTPSLGFRGHAEMGLHTFVTGEITGPGHPLHISNFTPGKGAPSATICFVYRTARALRDLGVIAPMVRSPALTPIRSGALTPIRSGALTPIRGGPLTPLRSPALSPASSIRKFDPEAGGSEWISDLPTLDGLPRPARSATVFDEPEPIHKPVRELHKVIEVWETVEGLPRRLVERRTVTVLDLTDD